MKKHKSNGKLNLFIVNKCKPPVSRNVRFATSIKKIIADIIMRNDFPASQKYTNCISGTLVTVTHVDVATDLRNVIIYVSPLNQSVCNEIVDFLNEQKKYFKDILAKTANMRYIPELLFKIDKSIEEAQKIEQLLSKYK